MTCERASLNDLVTAQLAQAVVAALYTVRAIALGLPDVLRAILPVAVADDYLMGVVIAHANRYALADNLKTLCHYSLPLIARYKALPDFPVNTSNALL
jgi:hypothetical protein